MQETVVVGEAAAGEFLAVGTMAEDGAFIGTTRQGQVNGAAETGQGNSVLGHDGRGRGGYGVATCVINM